jgi:copper resistance protein B
MTNERLARKPQGYGRVWTLWANGMAATGLFLSMAVGAKAAELDDQIVTSLEAEQLEYRIGNGGDGIFAWDVQGWAGTDYDKLVLKSEGEAEIDESVETAEVQLLYRRLISDFFDVQGGIRYDFRPDPSRVYGVLGLQGLAPYFVEVDANVFLSDQGDVSSRLEVEHDLLLTQRLVLQPSAELDIGFSDDSEIGVGSGVRSLELGLRLRYEVVRKFAPYLGVHWERKFGETANFARDEGEGTNDVTFVTGVRAWF